MRGRLIPNKVGNRGGAKSGPPFISLSWSSNTTKKANKPIIADIAITDTNNQKCPQITQFMGSPFGGIQFGVGEGLHIYSTGEEPVYTFFSLHFSLHVAVASTEEQVVPPVSTDLMTLSPSSSAYSSHVIGGGVTGGVTGEEQSSPVQPGEHIPCRQASGRADVDIFHEQGYGVDMPLGLGSEHTNIADGGSWARKVQKKDCCCSPEPRVG